MSQTQHTDYLAMEGPYGQSFPKLVSITDAEPFKLSEEHVAFFRENGYLPRVEILTGDQVARLRDGLEDIVNQRNGREDELMGADTIDAPGERKLTYMQGAWIIDEAIHDLVFHPAITVKLAQLLDAPRVRFWHDQVFYKPPKTGGNVAWHQDYSYWQRSKPSHHITVWIGLDDSTTENGCLHVVPGSHKWGLLNSTELTGDMEGLMAQLSPEQQEQFKPIPVEQPTGACSFHHDHTVHGSFPNQSERPRRAIILNYMADGVVSDAEDGVIMPGFDPIARGDVIRGKMFPLVIDMNALG
jgi:ectoine hydroxylase-related dioxygenase (phytanoyl-CoA dioxygenase family)